MSFVGLQEIRGERWEWVSICLDRVRFKGSVDVVDGWFRILVNGKEVFQNGLRRLN